MKASIWITLIISYQYKLWINDLVFNIWWLSKCFYNLLTGITGFLFGMLVKRLLLKSRKILISFLHFSLATLYGLKHSKTNRTLFYSRYYYFPAVSEECVNLWNYSIYPEKLGLYTCFILLMSLYLPLLPHANIFVTLHIFCLSFRLDNSTYT